MAFYDKWLDAALQRMGYMKADQVPVSVAWAGEMPAGPVTGWEAWTEEQVERLAVTSSWVFSDINTIASEASQAPFGVYRQEAESLEEVTAHPFEMLLQRPNAHMGKAFFVQYTLWWALLRGEAYWWLVPDRAGGLAEMWPIPAQRMQPIPDAKEYIRGFYYKPLHGRKPVEIPAGQVFFYRRHPNPFDYHRGLSPLTAYRLALETDDGARKWNRDTFDNEATLRKIISLPKELSRPEFDRRKTEIIDEFVENRRRLMVARAGDVTVQDIGLSHDDLEFLAGREFTREEIDRVFGVPAGFWAKEATRANAEAAKATMIEQGVWPVLVGLSEEITAQIVAPYYGEDLRGQFDDIRPRDRRLLVEERRQYWQVKTVDEARGDLGLDPLEDELLGGTLVPLAIRPQQPTLGGMPALRGGNGEMRADLRRWRSVALRRFREGKSPTEYDFESEHIPNDVWRDVMDGLACAETEDEVKAAFEVNAKKKLGCEGWADWRIDDGPEGAAWP